MISWKNLINNFYIIHDYYQFNDNIIKDYISILYQNKIIKMIIKAKVHEKLKLTGKGVKVGIIDSGINKWIVVAHSFCSDLIKNFLFILFY